MKGTLVELSTIRYIIIAHHCISIDVLFSISDLYNNLTAFLAYPEEIRKLIYTTNIIESFNASLRKFTKNKKVFPTDDAALKSLYLAAMQIKPKWNKSRFNWAKIYYQLFIHFENRIK